MARVLIIDDDEMTCKIILKVVLDQGHDASYALTARDGLKQALSESQALIFLDVRLPDGNGLELLPELRKTESKPEVIIITGHGEPDGAELAIRNGAWDYISKPASIHEIQLQLTRALQYRMEKKAQRPTLFKRESIIGHSALFLSSLERVAQAAARDITVLINGETGTGKELFARAIHENSSRSDKAYIVVDCTALPHTLVESVLFGHEKGAFTGADKACEGLIAVAEGGTLFLDEIGELPLSTQKTFLRVLQEHRFRPLGGKREIESNFRLVAATNRNLEDMVQQGTFRQDLLFRLNTFTIHVPPLRERVEDIEELAFYAMKRLCEQHQLGTKGFSPDFIEALERYKWPGNVRELFNAMENAFTEAFFEPTFFAKHLPTSIRVHLARTAVIKEKQTSPKTLDEETQLKVVPSFRDFKTDQEKQYLKKLLVATQGKIDTASHLSGLSRSRLYALLKQYGISPSP